MVGTGLPVQLHGSNREVLSETVTPSTTDEICGSSKIQVISRSFTKMLSPKFIYVYNILVD